MGACLARTEWNPSSRAPLDSEAVAEMNIRGRYGFARLLEGYLQLSLVTCPSSSGLLAGEKTHFHEINKKSGHRQQMMDEETGKVVDREHKGRG